MSKNLKKAIAIAALLAGTSGVAHATEGWYGRADVGYTFDGESDIDESGFGQYTLGHEHGWSEYLGLGYAFQNNFRLEGELGHRFNDFDEDDIDTEADLSGNGETRVWSAMANLFYDFNRGGSIEPYVGLGAGAARVTTNYGNHFADGEDTVAAYQAQVGFAVGLSPRWDLDIGYRYFVADSAEVEPTIAQDYMDQSLTVGVRYQFSPPPAPPIVTPPVQPPTQPPVVQQPPACPTSEFVVYFEWDRSNLNQAAIETIDAAVNRARQCNVGGVVVVGHTDTSGSPTYNQGLSERRASVVRDALVARGIGAGSIQTQARGEGDLARPTRDGVREPLNRRTAVTISFR
jgi:outer membrane protein OmpA-like peptidoglycan-associated protein